jgi:hypothetical protein
MHAQFFRSGAQQARRTATSRTLIALAVSTALLGACQFPGKPGGVDELNDLKGPTKVLSVDMHEGTNMATAPSPDGKRIVFSAQGA